MCPQGSAAHSGTQRRMSALEWATRQPSQDPRGPCAHSMLKGTRALSADIEEDATLRQHAGLARPLWSTQSAALPRISSGRPPNFQVCAHALVLFLTCIPCLAAPAPLRVIAAAAFISRLCTHSTPLAAPCLPLCLLDFLAGIQAHPLLPSLLPPHFYLSMPLIHSSLRRPAGAGIYARSLLFLDTAECMPPTPGYLALR